MKKLLICTILVGCSSVREFDTVGIHNTTELLLNKYAETHSGGEVKREKTKHWSGISRTVFFFSNKDQNFRKQTLNELGRYCKYASGGTWGYGGWCLSKDSREPLYRVIVQDFIRGVNPREEPIYNLRVEVQTPTSSNNKEMIRIFDSEVDQHKNNVQSFLVLDIQGKDINKQSFLICKKSMKAVYGWAVGATTTEVAFVNPRYPDSVYYSYDVGQFGVCSVSEIANDPSTEYMQVIKDNEPSNMLKVFETIRYVRDKGLYAAVDLP
ncbi:hypothetical protein [Vibrio ezurae]|uniref:Uncharacterized protein n=1 Tax=Vibrio ezurae NBRC 102218 TaxID=1219080 RepID=U3B3B7_9VIBR|nr:hypothetical protein [Vibrio ezurae]GAD80435.1 hypothetical protein VEZ01S_36_00250 [Vibrio ezurae NBRC 102218]